MVLWAGERMLGTSQTTVVRKSIPSGGRWSSDAPGVLGACAGAHSFIVTGVAGRFLDLHDKYFPNFAKMCWRVFWFVCLRLCFRAKVALCS